MVLDFLNIGAAKSGTTSLHDILIQHPDICIPREKDFHFFDSDLNYKKGKSWYEDKFKASSANQVLGEVSATYLYSSIALKRMVEDYGTQVKILVMLRNPARRAFSEYQHQLRSSDDRVLDFNEYFKAEGSITKSMPLYETIIDRGFYFQHLEKFINAYGSHQIKVCFFEEFVKDPQAVINEIFDFLEVTLNTSVDVNIKSNPRFNPKSKIFHRMFYTNRGNPIKKALKLLVPSFRLREKIRKYFRNINTRNDKSQTMNEDLYSYLMKRIYADDIANLEKYLGRTIECWRV